MFAGAKFCPRCGAAAARVEQEHAARQCPSCRNELQRIEIGTTRLMECDTCDGVWVDAESFERLCASREASAAVLHKLQRTAPGRIDLRVQYRRCPQCGTMMNRVNFGKVSGTVVDVCKGHGTWLDAGELHRIVAFVQNGGLERARENQIQELKEREKRVREAEVRAALDRGKADPHSALEIGAGMNWSPGDLLDLITAIRRNS
jgi:Zn-finger nucleic acid-binding protein